MIGTCHILLIWLLLPVVGHSTVHMISAMLF